MKALIKFSFVLLLILFQWGCDQKSEAAYEETYEYADAVAEEAAKEAVDDFNTEEYDEIQENQFLSTAQKPLSTFSIDVDNASYTNVRRLIKEGVFPEKGAVRIEEMINYFDYNYPNPTGDAPFSVNYELTDAPWNKNHQLLRIGIQGKMIDYEEVNPSNLVFLIDTSGSMSDKNKLPLLIKSFQLMAENLHPKSKVAIVTYAGSSEVALESTSVKNIQEIMETLENLQVGGGTHGSEGIETAYDIAKDNFIEGGNNRVILATDGDFNVGNTSRSGLLDLIQAKAKDDIFLTICGFGMDNYKDGTMEAISNRGNGNYFYIDNWSEAQKVFKKELVANLFTIAKDVKIQIEFNPNTVKEYRLIGYENRKLNDEDFNDDTKDAGELGAGHTVTAIYELIPVGAPGSKSGKVDPLKYQSKTSGNNNTDVATIKFRYKPIESNSSKLITKVIGSDDLKSWNSASSNQKFATSVAAFGMLLRESEFAKDISYSQVVQWAKSGLDDDPEGYRNEFIRLVHQAEDLK